MRKLIAALAALSLAAVLSGCGSDGAQPSITALPPSDGGVPDAETAAETKAEEIKVDLDLSSLGESMAYSTLLNMMMTPEDYIGKTIRINGMFDIAGGEIRDYYLCTLFDTTGCCGSSLEFMPKTGLTYPEGLPEVLSYISVTGVFETYEEDGRLYCQLSDATVSEIKMQYRNYY